MFNRLSKTTFAVALALAATGATAATITLPAYNVKKDETSVSGISSGAYMAVQVAVAHSSFIKGVGAIAGGPYYCAQNNMFTATGTCMIGTPSAASSVSYANTVSSQGKIDAVSNLTKMKVWMLNGYNDGVLKQPVSNALYDFFKAFTPEQNIYYSNNTNAAHSQVTDRYGQTCNVTGGNFMNNCGYDAAGLILKHIYGNLNARNTGTLSGSFYEIDQDAFVSGDSWLAGMSHYAYLYVPAACAAQQACRLHVAFHGCKQYATKIGDQYYKNAGYNEWADTNNMIVLYPQTVATTVTPLNPNGCWDWWGYQGGDYAVKSSYQITAIKGMIDKIASGYTGWSGAPAGSFAAPALTAATSTHQRVALHWNPVATATGYNVYRATAAAGPFSKVNTALVTGASFADSGRLASTTYYYRVRAVNASNVESADSNTVSRATAANPASCDPYHRDNVSHYSEGRAVVLWGWEYAAGSSDAMGLWNIAYENMLRKTGPGYYKVGPCA